MKEESLTMFQMQLENTFRSVEEDLNQKIVEISREHTKKVLKVFLSSVFEQGENLFAPAPQPLRTRETRTEKARRKKRLKKKKATKAVKAKRVQNQATLHDEVVAVMQKKGKPMSVKEVSDAVLAKGYKTTSKHFPNCVYALFGQNKKDTFRKTGTGKHTLKPSLRRKK